FSKDPSFGGVGNNDIFEEPMNTDDDIDDSIGDSGDNMEVNDFQPSDNDLSTVTESADHDHQEYRIGFGGSNTCSYCHGSGYYWSCGENVTCIRCGGSGIGS
ncbi:MAG: hypothetical protein ACRDEA_19400, partial [Microcystaceae cyanobacterium]